jgi:hypothetical protein
MVKEADLDKIFHTYKPNLNNHERILEVHDDSLNYLKNNKEIYIKLADYFCAYYEIGDLIPQTLNNFASGHYFPYSESYFELENSYQLYLEGFYTYSFAALRSVLELGILGISFTVADKEHKEVRPWITSEKRTPNFKSSLKKLNSIPFFKEFDERFNYVENVYDVYDHLSGFIHTRGYLYSSTSKNKGNINRFNEEAILEYLRNMFSIISNLIALMLIKYPIGLKSLPLFEKFGFNSLAGGFLEDYQVKLIKSVLNKNELEFIENISDNDCDVQSIVEQIESMLI